MIWMVLSIAAAAVIGFAAGFTLAWSEVRRLRPSSDRRIDRLVRRAVKESSHE